MARKIACHVLQITSDQNQEVLDSSSKFAIKPTDFHGVFPKLVCKEGDKVKAGQPLFYSKYQDSIQFVSPVSGTLTAVKRGAKRKVLELSLTADEKNI